MPQVPYDDIRRALEKAQDPRDTAQDYRTAWAHARELLYNNAEALLADAQRWRMIAEPSEEVVEAVARAIDRFQRGDDFLWRTEVDTARVVLRTLEGLVK